MSALLVIVILIVLIVGHELGHFIVAKIKGVKVEEFGIGYPPRVLTFGKIGNTEYTLNWLPFGGFVRLFGEKSSEKSAGSFSGAPNATKAAILVAGVCANVLIGWTLFVGGFMLGMPTAVDSAVPGARLLVSAVVPNSPAAESGLAAGDEIKSVIAEDGTGASELTPMAVSEFIANHGGKAVTVTYERDTEISTVSLKPVHAVLENEEGRPALGVALTSIAHIALPFGAAVVKATTHTVSSLVSVAAGLGSLLWNFVTGSDAHLSELVGPVGLVNVVDDATGYGWGYVLGLAGFISLNLAIINLIPIPALDGGRLLFIGLEGITRRKIPHIVEGVLNALGFAAIIILMLAVTYNDVIRIF